MKKMYEIIIPTMYGDTLKPIKTKHHKSWDRWVQSITGGLTILSSAKGKWIYNGVEYPEKVIPVRICCEQKDIQRIIQFTLSHYRQKVVLAYCVSSEIYMMWNENL